MWSTPADSLFIFFSIAKKKVHYTENNIQKALDYLHTEHTKNVSQVANKFGVTRTTLHNHWKELTKPVNQSQKVKQLLIHDEEIVLTD